MEDLFAAEQKVFEDAVAELMNVREGAMPNPDKYKTLTVEYGRLLRQLRRATRMSDRAMCNLNTSNMALQSKVHYDALTCIYNRRFMEESLERIVKSLSRSKGWLSVLMLDIDYFKKYNDTYGHSKGDTCLKTVADVISSCLSRADDFVARYGGEEFAVILPNTGEEGAHIIANKILQAIRERNIPHEKNEATGCVTISIGITSGEVKHGQSGEDYIKRADSALYMSKENGRDRFTYLDFYKEELL